jgi:hypothetical protein
MRLRRSLCRFGWLLGFLGLAGLAIGQTQPTPRQHGRKLEESPAYNGEVVTNLLQSSKRQDSLKRLEEELRRTLQPFAPEAEEMLTPNLGPVVNPVMRNPRVRDRKQDFLSLTAEELLMPGVPDDMRLQLSEGKSQGSDKLSFEQLYMELFLKDHNDQNKSDQNKTKPAQKRDDPLHRRDMMENPDKEVTKADANLPPGIRDSQKKLKEMLDAAWTANGFNLVTPPGSSLANLFAPHDQSLTREQEEAHKEYMDKYRLLLNGPTPPALAVNPLNPFPATDASVPSPYSPLGTLTTPLPHVGLDGNPSGFSPTALVDPTTKAINQWNTYYTPPKLEPPPKVAPPSIPMSHVPQRVF